MAYRKILISLCIAVAILELGSLAIVYRKYAHAAAWHYFHSANLRIGVHEIEIPRLWWVAKKDNAGRISILRAWRSSSFIEPEIEIAPVGPGEFAESDSNESGLDQAVVSGMNRDPQSGWTHSSKSIQANGSVWHCIKDQQTVFGRNFSTTLTCNAPRIPYSLYYKGPTEQEGEAEQIFASFQ